MPSEPHQPSTKMSVNVSESPTFGTIEAALVKFQANEKEGEIFRVARNEVRRLLRPEPDEDFEVIKEAGSGNFSSIVHVVAKDHGLSGYKR